MEDYIDYSDSTDLSEDKWTHKTFKKYFIDTFFKIHKAGGAIPWSMKEQVLLSTMMEEYKPEDLTDLMVYWHLNIHRMDVACQFTNFYNNRIHLFEKMKKAHSEYKW